MSAILTYLSTKLASAVSGLCGGLSVSFFWAPKALHRHGPFIAGVIIGGISTSAAFMLGGIVANMAGLDFTNMDVALGLGYCVGVLSVGVIALVARFFGHSEEDDADILDVVRKQRRRR